MAAVPVRFAVIYHDPKRKGLGSAHTLHADGCRDVETAVQRDRSGVCSTSTVEADGILAALEAAQYQGMPPSDATDLGGVAAAPCLIKATYRPAPTDHAGLRSWRRAKATGTHVGVYNGDEAGLDTDGGEAPWSTICDEHGGIASHFTLADAEHHAGKPEQWCPVCQRLRLVEGPDGTWSGVDVKEPSMGLPPETLMVCDSLAEAYAWLAVQEDPALTDRARTR